MRLPLVQEGTPPSKKYTSTRNLEMSRAYSIVNKIDGQELIKFEATFVYKIVRVHKSMLNSNKRHDCFKMLLPCPSVGFLSLIELLIINLFLFDIVT